MSIFEKLFSKKAKPAPVIPPEKKSLIDAARENDFKQWKKPKLDRPGILASMFPRTHADLKVVTPTQNGTAMDESAVTMDASFDGSSLHTSEIPDKVLEFFGSHSFIGWQACAVLRQNYLIEAACTIPAKDAMAPDYLLSYAENNKTKAEKDSEQGVDEERLAELKQIASDDFNIGDICQHLTINKKTFGIGLAIPVVDGADMSKPYNPDGIRKGSYKGFTIVEPYWVSPQMDADAASNPGSQHFYEPTWWRVSGKLVHRSWCIKVVNSVLPDIMKPTYYYGGIPLPQMIYERVYAADTTANEAPALAKTKRMLVADADVDNLIANPEAATEIINAISYMRDNFGVWFKRPGDQVAQIDTSLSDYDDLIMTQYQLCASIAEMPMTKLMKTTLKGFNPTGDYEWKDYAQSLISIQTHDYVPLIRRHLEMYLKSSGSQEENLVVTFNPVDVPTEKEVAEVAEIYSRVDSNYADSGVIGTEEVRQIIRNEDESRYSTISELNEDLSDDLDEEAEEIAAKVEDAAFVESEHPRDDVGKFSESEGGGGGVSKKNSLKSNVTYNRLITSQKFISDEIVENKRENKDYDVKISPVFTVDGEDYQVILDGHHSLRAAELDGEDPVFSIADTSDDDRVSFLEDGDIDGFLEAVHMGEDYRFVKNSGLVW